MQLNEIDYAVFSSPDFAAQDLSPLTLKNNFSSVAKPNQKIFGSGELEYISKSRKRSDLCQTSIFARTISGRGSLCLTGSEVARFENGWFKIHRSLFENPLYAECYTLALFCHILGMANYKPSKCIFKGQPLLLQPGQLLTGSLELAKRLKTTRSVIETRLKRLEVAGTIQQQTSNKGTLITIVNWSTYQLHENINLQPDRNRSTTDLHQIDNKSALNEESNKVRKEEHNYMSPQSAIADSERPFRAPVKELAKLWNEIAGQACSSIKIETLQSNTKRYRWAQARLREQPDLQYWRSVIEKIVGSPFCTGANQRGWRADFEFLVRQETHVKVMEGKFDNRSQNAVATIDWQKVIDGIG